MAGNGAVDLGHLSIQAWLSSHPLYARRRARGK